MELCFFSFERKASILIFSGGSSSSKDPPSTMLLMTSRPASRNFRGRRFGGKPLAALARLLAALGERGHPAQVVLDVDVARGVGQEVLELAFPLR